jgi:broad specificity phosphatase PhoE
MASFLRRAAFPADVAIEPGQPGGTVDRVAHAVAGPERRCVQTGQLFGLDPAIDVGLRDWDYGSWAGRGLDEVSGVEEWIGDPASAPHGGESLHGVLSRVGAWLDETPFPPGGVALFTHPAIVRAAVVHALRAGPESFWRIDVEPLSQTTIAGGPGRWNLRM